MNETIYRCSVCGETTEASINPYLSSAAYRGGSGELDYDEDWLLASVPGSASGEMVIRCPEHITEYAIRKAGGHVEDGNGIVNGWSYEIKRGH